MIPAPVWWLATFALAVFIGADGFGLATQPVGAW